MQSFRVVSRVMNILLILLVTACNRSPSSQEGDFEDFDPANFSNPTRVDNIWFSLIPGTQFTYEGETIEDGESVPHRIIITVTDLTKVIGGVRSVVTWDRDYSADVLVEAELAFFAQDDDGNVWRMGEYPEEYEDGEFTIAPTWVHGFQDARAGIAMQANPQTDTPSYSQGWGPAVDWTDRGQVDEMGQEVCVPADCYTDVLVIAETSEAEPGAVQLKYYAQGVGNIRTNWRGEDQTQETLELVEVVQLSPEALAEARASALELELHAYEVSTDMYVHTLPIEYPEGTPAIDVEVIPTDVAEASQSNVNIPAGSLAEIVVYASDIPERALYEMEFWDDPASPGGILIGVPNTGEELDPPPENDPHVTFNIQVQSGVPYRCWIHMLVGVPDDNTQANLIWVQFSDAVNQANQEVFSIDSDSYLTAQGLTQQGWVWVGCDLAGSDSLVYFQTDGEITVWLQPGMEGVGFDQFVLSAEEYLDTPPSAPIVEK